MDDETDVARTEQFIFQSRVRCSMGVQDCYFCAVELRIVTGMQIARI
jgi:hypothetical protein